MIILRAARENDVDTLLDLFQFAHLGLTSLPKNHSQLALKIQRSILSFQKRVEKPGDEYYFFVLEDDGKVIGCSAIFATTGGGEPLYFFKQETEENQKLLSPVSYVRGPSELCSLFLHPDVRKKGVGKLLSFGRLLFVANHPNRFTESFFAELRGVIVNDHSPFWDGLGSHFLHITFSETQERLQAGRHFISSFLPKHPIYVTLLAEEAQAVIGKTHPHTEAALKLLLQQGFQVSDEVDVFDGGPKLMGSKQALHAISHSKLLPLIAIDETQSEPLAFLSNTSLTDFRATMGSCRITKEGITLSKETMEALHLRLHDQVRLYEVAL